MKNKKDQKPDQPTAGNLPDHQKEFENTTWQEKENKDSDATEAERVNVSKTLPKTASREEKKSSDNS
jgi:hypothetical protein